MLQSMEIPLLYNHSQSLIVSGLGEFLISISFLSLSSHYLIFFTSTFSHPIINCSYSISDITSATVGKEILVRARVHASRETGKILFLSLRQAYSTVQAIALKNENKDLFKFASGIARESVVDVAAIVAGVDTPITSA